MIYISNITTSQQVYIPRQVVNTGSSTNGGCINLEDYYTREEVDALISAATSDVTKEYVDNQDAATLREAKNYADTIDNRLKLRIGSLFDYRSNTLYPYVNPFDPSEKSFHSLISSLPLRFFPLTSYFLLLP